MTVYVRTQEKKSRTHFSARNSARTRNVSLHATGAQKKRVLWWMETLGALRMHVRLGSYLNTFQLLRGSRSEIIETMIEARALFGRWIGVSEWASVDTPTVLCAALSVIALKTVAFPPPLTTTSALPLSFSLSLTASSLYSPVCLITCNLFHAEILY